MSRLKLVGILVAILALASCGEFPTEPAQTMQPTSGAVSQTGLSRTPDGMVLNAPTNVHAVKLNDSTFAVTWMPVAPYVQDGFWVRIPNANYIATYPPPYEIPDPNATSVVKVVRVPCTVGMWEVLAYKRVGRELILSRPGVIPPKEGAQQLSGPGS
jgi:hypothetical protein